MNLSIELYHLPNNHANWLTLLLNRAFSAYYAQYRYRSPMRKCSQIVLTPHCLGPTINIKPCRDQIVYRTVIY